MVMPKAQGKFFGRAFGEVALAVVGTKGVDKVLKGGNIVSNSGKAGKAIDGIKKLSDKTVKVVREVGNGRTRGQVSRTTKKSQLLFRRCLS